MALVCNECAKGVVRGGVSVQEVSSECAKGVNCAGVQRVCKEGCERRCKCARSEQRVCKR